MDWSPGDPANGPLGNEKLLAALFSDDSVKNKRNTETVEVAANTLVAARIVDYKPSALQPFESVKANIESLLKRQEAQASARKDGEARLEALKKARTSWPGALPSGFPDGCPTGSAGRRARHFQA